ncbi:MAG TPA: FKBP-type peptidyl-prolyl cis-trans isomerase [Daejeonella sp.]|nr:FKBP-type peptidyl-prolyl cis-trans isomerase [Daejeonella sp.]
MKHLLLILLVSVTALSACKKEPSYDPYKQLAADELLIQDFIAKNNIPAVRHESGLYYQIIAPGSGNITYTTATQVTAKYEGRLLNGQVFDNGGGNPATFPLGGVIGGWQIGVPLIQKNGKIRLLIPSGYAYGPNAQRGIPANSILDFDVELVDVQNQN